ncbi:MAG: DUF4430 domain-containing protein, partial [Syntrophomonadaceae bacterium]|nr:DUF4430 domain-containing protein [Syntrophomonadaceae bacterium]
MAKRIICLWLVLALVVLVGGCRVLDSPVERSEPGGALSGPAGETVITEKDPGAPDARGTVPQEYRDGRLRQKTPRCTLWVSTDFGREVVYQKTLPFEPGESIADVMRRNLQIETAYGGGFVNSINGISSAYTNKGLFSRQKKDWFCWVNGVLCSEGANCYQLADRDVIWWDYHDWNGGYFTPAVIGGFPGPFIGGYAGEEADTVIICAGGYEELARLLKQGLERHGVKNVSAAPYQNNLINNRNRITIV